MKDDKEWAVISDFPNYKISKSGIVARVDTERVLPLCKNVVGNYLVVRLWHRNKTRMRPVYRLLAEAFIPNPENKPEVNHIDGDRMNMSLHNLEWCTRSENMKHAYKHGLLRGTFKKGTVPKNKILSEADIDNFYKLKLSGLTWEEVATEVGMSAHYLSGFHCHEHNKKYKSVRDYIASDRPITSKGRTGYKSKLGEEIIQLSLNGDIVAIHGSIAEAARNSGAQVANIHRVLKGKRNHAGKFYWIKL